jgi:hypothetical protein
MASTHEPYLETLGEVVAALERGDWRTAWLEVFRGEPSGGRANIVDLAVCLRCVTRSMRFQCAVGNVLAASHQLETAARKLLRQHVYSVDPGPEPPIAWQAKHLAWATNRLVQREKAELAALEAVFQGLPRGRQELIYACVEHLVWVEFDPWTVRVHPEDRTLLDIDGDAYERFRVGNRGDMCARATRLRQFADIHGGTVSEKVWQRMGGYSHVREAALRVLAAESVTRGSVGGPVRLGRVRAWFYAHQWLRDTTI